MGKRDVFKAPQARAYLSYDPDLVSDATGVDCSMEKLKSDIEAGLVPEQDILAAHQEFKDDCDINKIIERYDKVGVPLPRQNAQEWMNACGDFTSGFDYREACESVLAARESFMELDAKVRNRFDNDPGKMLDFLADGRNRQEAVALGLVVPSVEVPKADSGQAGGQVVVPPVVKP